MKPRAPAKPVPAKRFSWSTLCLSIALTFVATSFCWLLFGYYALSYTSEVVGPPFVVSLELPEEVALGETFEMVAKVENTSADAQIWTSLDVYDVFMENFRLKGSEPQVKHRQHVYDFTVLGFDLPLEPGGIATVTLSLEAHTVGSFSGYLDFCDPAGNYVSDFAEVSVVEPEE